MGDNGRRHRRQLYVVSVVQELKLHYGLATTIFSRFFLSISFSSFSRCYTLPLLKLQMDKPEEKKT